jgi:hypothetical protein
MRWMVVAGVLVVLVAGCATPPAAPAPQAAPASKADARTPVVLDDAERNFVLAEMRNFVEVMRVITAAIAENDMKRVASAARSVGMAPQRAESKVPGSLLSRVAKKAQPEFMKLGFATHSAFDEMAIHAEQFGDRDHLVRQLSGIMGQCVACHATYRLPE